jgi:hypothetical protein
MTHLHARLVVAFLFVGTIAPVAATAAPKNVNSCGTVGASGSYELTKNLTASGDCLVVTADFVTIDLSGFTIFGDGTGDGIKGDVARKAITIRNGTIANFDDGIDFCAASEPATPGHQMVIEDIRAIDNADAGICLLSLNVVAGLTVRNSSASGNGGAGMALGGRAVVSGNTVSDNTNGIVISGTASIIGNTIAGNSNAGILSGNHSFDIINNRVQGLNIGIQIFCPSVVMGNVIGGATPLIANPSAGVCTIDHNTQNPF